MFYASKAVGLPIKASWDQGEMPRGRIRSAPPTSARPAPTHPGGGPGAQGGAVVGGEDTAHGGGPCRPLSSCRRGDCGPGPGLLVSPTQCSNRRLFLRDSESFVCNQAPCLRYRTPVRAVGQVSEVTVLNLGLGSPLPSSLVSAFPDGDGVCRKRAR